jgi:hypothetical protein
MEINYYHTPGVWSNPENRTLRNGIERKQSRVSEFNLQAIRFSDRAGVAESCPDWLWSSPFSALCKFLHELDTS